MFCFIRILIIDYSYYCGVVAVICVIGGCFLFWVIIITTRLFSRALRRYVISDIRLGSFRFVIALV
ncbi:hypothetical protein HanPSC8_Chr00c103g0804621 [Helianthus annuus]|nr:hypothetical protein HanPSC8_Chr00c103g0804621 [Helianthus annuus]